MYPCNHSFFVALFFFWIPYISKSFEVAIIARWHSSRRSKSNGTTDEKSVNSSSRTEVPISAVSLYCEHQIVDGSTRSGGSHSRRRRFQLIVSSYVLYTSLVASHYTLYQGIRRASSRQVACRASRSGSPRSSSCRGLRCKVSQ